MDRPCLECNSGRQRMSESHECHSCYLEHTKGPPPMPVQAFKTEYGLWAEHPDYSLADWRYEVVNNTTRQGYWKWAESLEMGENIGTESKGKEIHPALELIETLKNGIIHADIFGKKYITTAALSQVISTYEEQAHGS